VSDAGGLDGRLERQRELGAVVPSEQEVKTGKCFSRMGLPQLRPRGDCQHDPNSLYHVAGRARRDRRGEANASGVTRITDGEAAFAAGREYQGGDRSLRVASSITGTPVRGRVRAERGLSPAARARRSGIWIRS
jgi:hypothetical protein